MIKIAIVEDDRQYLDQLTGQFKAIPWVDLDSVFHSRNSALNGLISKKVDIIFIDLGLPDGSGIDIIREIRKVKKANNESLNFIVLTVFSDDKYLFDALKAGATGYLLKDEVSPLELEKIINDVLKGGSPVSPSIARKIINEFQRNTSINCEKIENLTKREFEILEYLSKGYSAKQIADLANISYHTVRVHLKNIYKKLQVNSNIEAVSLFKKAS